VEGEDGAGGRNATERENRETGRRESKKKKQLDGEKEMKKRRSNSLGGPSEMKEERRPREGLLLKIEKIYDMTSWGTAKNAKKETGGTPIVSSI